MKADFTRLTFKPEKHYDSVRMQQGRVQLDADWNEQVDITAHRIETETVDVVGPCGAPLTGGGFEIGLTSGGSDLTISPGRFYVDGILCELEPGPQVTTYISQPDYPNPPAPKPDSKHFVVYLDVWQRHLTALEDPEIREIALGGPDTATRTKTVWQVKLLPAGDGPVHCLTPVDWSRLPAPSTGKLRARAHPGDDDENLCAVPAGAGYRRLENQLYRVEIHEGGAAQDATFKWSRENGSVVFPIRGVSTRTVKDDEGQTTVETIIELGHLGRDTNFGLLQGNWVEVVDDDYTLHHRAELLLEVKEIDVANRKVVLAGELASSVGKDLTKHPLLRRWDHKERKDKNLLLEKGAVKLVEGSEDTGWLDLESGVQIQFPQGPPLDPAQYRAGDYWLIPARTARGDFRGDVLWPGNPQDPKDALAQPPEGIRRHHCRLAMAQFDGTKWIDVHDCRPRFPALTEFTILHYVSGDGQEAMPQDMKLPKPFQVRVANGEWPVVGACVQFTLVDGDGTLEVGSTPQVSMSGDMKTLVSSSAADGVVECFLNLGTTHRYRVQAVLLDAARQPLPSQVVRFNANLSIASQVAYNPAECWKDSGPHDVQRALDHFCAVRHLHYVSGDGQEGPPGQLLPFPLIAGVTDGLGRAVPDVAVKFEVTSGGGKVGPAGASPSSTFTGTTNGEGLVECRWELGSDPGALNVVTATLEGLANKTLPIRFTSSSSGIHVVKVSIANDSDVKAEELTRGIQIVCDAPLDPVSISSATVFLTVRMPLGTAELAAVGLIYYSLIVDAKVEIKDGAVVVLTPTPGSLNQVAKMFAESGLKASLLARLTLKGNFIWATKPPGLYLDGEAFGIPAENNKKTEVRFPSGDGRPGGDFEMWFWLVLAEAPEIVVDPTRLDFGNVVVNSFRDLTLTIRNARTRELQIMNISNSAQFIVQGPSTLVVPPNTEQKLTIRFTPGSQVGRRDGILTISSNDPNTPSVTVELAGTAVPAAPLPFGTLRGRVFDESTRAAISGAKVTVSNVAMGVRRDATTGQDGGYLFERLAPGQYDVQVSSQGFREFKQAGVLLEAGGTREVNAALKSAIG